MKARRRGLGRLPRRPTLTVLLGPRDRLLMQALRKARVLRTPDLVPIVFPSMTIATRRLRRLNDAGYVALHCEHLHEPSRIMLDRRGYELLASGASDPLAAETAPPVPPGIGPHGYTVRRFYTLLVAACHATPGVRLSRFLFEHEYATAPDEAQASYRPDALFELQCETGLRGFVVEVDLGTESARYVVEKKLSLFERLRVAGAPLHGVTPDELLLLVHSERRLASIASLASEAQRSLPVHLHVLDVATASLSLVAGWQPLNAPTRPGALLRGDPR